MFTAQQIREIIAVYGTWPDTPEGYEEPTEFRSVESGEFWISEFSGDMCGPCGGGYSRPRLILQPKPKRYRWVCDDPTPRISVKGDWVARVSGESRETGQRTASELFEMTTEGQYPCLIFRREEVPSE